nr:hypothetical protein [Tanacetum cinerariifolium]
MDQAPVDIDGFAPHWLGEQFPNINNGWIEWDVPLGGEMDEPMVDPEVNEEVMDGDNWDVEVERLMAPVTPPRATMTASSTYEVGGPSTAAIEELSFPLPVPGLPVPSTVIEDLGTRLVVTAEGFETTRFSPSEYSSNEGSNRLSNSIVDVITSVSVEGTFVGIDLRGLNRFVQTSLKFHHL